MGLYGNQKEDIWLDYNLEEYEELEYNQGTCGASKDNTLDVNFGDSEYDISIVQEISIDHEEILEEVTYEGERKIRVKER